MSAFTIFQQLQLINEPITAKNINKFRKLKIQAVSVYEDILFLKKCRKEHLFPKFITIKMSVDNWRSRAASEKARRSWLINEIKHKYGILQNVNIMLYKLMTEINFKIKGAATSLWENELNKIEASCEFMREKKKAILKKKFSSLKGNLQTINTTEPPEENKFVRNLTSGETFSQDEVNLLNKGLKYVIKPFKPPVEDIVISLEAGLSMINEINDNQRAQIRSETGEVLKKFNRELDRNSKKEQKIIKNLRAKQCFFSNPDKGKAVVVMKKLEYDDKMLRHIQEGPYREIQDRRWKDGTPINAMQSRVINLVKDFHMKYNMNYFEAQKLITPNPRLPAIYGSTKLHKTGYPLRPIVSQVQSPTNKLSDWLVKETSKLNLKKGFSIKNAYNLIEDLTHIELQEDEMMISFDVVGLYPNIPITEALKDLIEDVKNQRISEYMKTMIAEAAELSMKSTEFQFRGKFYKQTFGTSMGNRFSPFLANHHMAKLEENIKKLPWFPRFWRRYMDDVFAIVKKNETLNTLEQLNLISPTIKFTQELEENGKLPFLDLQLKRNRTKIEFSIYRKPTTTQQLIHESSNHHPRHKEAAFHSMIHRLVNVPMKEENFKEELKYIKETAKINGYKEDMINNILKKHSRKKYLKDVTTLNNDKENEEDIKGWISLPYYTPITNELSKILKKQNIKTCYTNGGNLRDLLGTEKDKENNILRKSGIYRLTCENCEKKYVGQTKRCLETRLQEHLNETEIPIERIQSAMSLHAAQQNHQIGGIELIREVTKPYMLNAAESLHIAKENDGTLTNKNLKGNLPSTLYEFC